MRSAVVAAFLFGVVAAVLALGWIFLGRGRVALVLLLGSAAAAVTLMGRTRGFAMASVVLGAFLTSRLLGSWVELPSRPTPFDFILLGGAGAVLAVGAGLGTAFAVKVVAERRPSS